VTFAIQKAERQRKTPADVTEFEREQLRFFLSGDELTATLASLNPSLAWLPVLSEMKLIRSERQLSPWIRRNLGDVDALREVISNLSFFGPETGTFLKSQLETEAAALPALLVKSWNLIIRHMCSIKQGLARLEWFELMPQIKRGEHNSVMLERIANALRPKLKIKKRFTWYRDAEKSEPKVPADLMAIDYEVDEGVSSNELLAAWPSDATPSADKNLLRHLTAALNAALADASDVGVKSNEGYSASDSDVPSVARHAQNEYRSGFQAIVRVIAEIWTRLAKKDPSSAINFVELWAKSEFRLVRRIALYAAADNVVPSGMAAEMLEHLPAGELFLTGSSVEVHRLILERWVSFDEVQQNMILARLCAGPPRDWYRDGAEIDRSIDRLRYEALSDMARSGLRIGDAAAGLLNEIQDRYPEWLPKPSEQVGFHVWHESGFRDVAGDPDDLANVPDDKLVSLVKKTAADAGFMDGDKWQGLVLKEPDRAVRGLAYAAKSGDWPEVLWQQLLWSTTPYSEESTETDIARLLVACSVEVLATFAPAAAAWLDNRTKSLPDSALWPLWDQLASAVQSLPEPTHE
jgi:hypothetical protein